MLTVGGSESLSSGWDSDFCQRPVGARICACQYQVITTITRPRHFFFEMGSLIEPGDH